MRRNTLLLIIFLFLIAVGLGYLKYRFVPELQKQNVQVAEQSSTSPSPSTQLESVVDKTFGSLSSHQKILQLIAYPVNLASVDATASATMLPSSAQTFLSQNIPGFVTLYGQKLSATKTKQTIDEVKTLTDGSMLAPLFAVDHEGGSVQRLSGTGFTVLPSLQSWCESSNPYKIDVVSASAKELREVGIDAIFGPTVDVATTSSFLRTRLCSDDPKIVIEHAEAWGRAFASQGILPVIKHYPGIGTATKDLHLGLVTIAPPASELQIFTQILTDYSNWGVMVSHGGIENSSGVAQPCSLDPQCLEPLRSAFPRTLLFTDGLEMKALQTASGSAQPTVDLGSLSIKAIQAGNDVLVFGGGISPAQFTRLIEKLETEYQGNADFRNKVDVHAKRVLEYKQMLNVQ
jgi:beta-N-acetylhexosaminidase